MMKVIRQKIKEPGGDWETYANLEGQTIKGSMEIYFSFIYIGTSEQDDIRLSYYPNPAQDYLFIDSSRKIKNLSVYDMNGKMLPKKLTEPDNNKINTIRLPTGVYTVKFILENGQLGTFKFIKK